LEGHGDGGGAVDDERSERGYCDEVAGDCAEDGADDDGTAESGEDGVGDEDDEADDRAAGAGGSWPCGDAE
jgi:hypothetical protein